MTQMRRERSICICMMEVLEEKLKKFEWVLDMVEVMKEVKFIWLSTYGMNKKPKTSLDEIGSSVFYG